jgi:hypothetical protein
VAVLSGTPDDPSQTSSLNVTVSGTNVTNYRYALGASSLDCTNAGNYSSSLAVATTITDTLSTTGSLKLCVVAQNSQGTWQDFSSATTHTWTRLGPISLSVTAAYPTNGANWNSYVKNDGASLTSALDTACAGTELGYNLCLHGGEMRRVIVTGVPSCSGLTLTDSLGVFTWSCETRSGVANFFSTGFQSGKGLKDLVDASSWKNNSVTLSGTFTGSSTSTTWWTNPVVPLPDNSLATDASITLDGTNDGGNDGVFTAGTIFTLASSRASSGYTLGLPRLAIITLAGATLSYSGRSVSNCNGGDFCLMIGGSGSTFAWIEGTFNGISSGGGTNATYGLFYSSVYFYRNHLNVIQSFSNIGAIWRWSHSFRVTDFTASGNGFNGALVLGNTSSNFLVDRANITVNTGNGISAGPVSSSVYQDITITGGSYRSFVLEGDNNLVRRIKLSASSGSGLAFGGNGNRFFDVQIAKMGQNGIEIFGATSGNLLSRFVVASAGPEAGGAGGLRLWTSVSGNWFTDFVIQNARHGIWENGSDNNHFIRGTLVNNAGSGIFLENGADQNTFNQLILANNSASGVEFSGTASSGNTFSQIVTAHNGAHGANLAALSTLSKFTGSLLVGFNATKACSVSGGTNAGLSDTTCTTAGTEGSSSYTSGFVSDAVLGIGRTVASSFVGKVTTDDPVNTSDTNGSAPHPASPTTFDWLNFSAPYRAWGVDGTAFPSSSHAWYWTSNTGRIWDWRLLSTDTTLRERSGDGSNANEAFIASATCPSAVLGNRVAVDQQASPQTYLLNAVEVVDPADPLYGASGDRDGLCESGESCIYLPNFGAYQGHGTLSPCTFNDAGGTTAITGVQMYGYTSNGI